MYKNVLLAAAMALGASAFVAPAANAASKIGLLTCQSDGALGLVVTSTKNYLCVFTPASRGLPTEPYVARLDTYGVDLGITGRQDFSWAVYAASFHAGEPVSLAGTYYGTSVDASVAAGGGAKSLIGGPDNGFTLQSIGLQAQFGLNATAGISRFELRPGDTGTAVYKP
ncbi:hypothetical protein GCM10011390_49580 [Aureimonas endophytica]|uniref:DUF992 domain-containing protein n=1 Tax=Aureimonas endophytica TaxID=2027858 RepID=A0A917A361_9HYPH|nr:DUF992 domain-containing protein [Aureimonas endophytica]GGE24264.1 hypothetical protein GCM10011390_49580 [Aureimonas endophytica]